MYARCRTDEHGGASRYFADADATYPSYIFKVGQSEFAVDEELAREIFVRQERA